MRIALISRNPRLYSTTRLVEAARCRGHHIDVIDPIACTITIAHGRQDVMHRGERLQGYDVVVPRIGASITDYGLAVLGCFEQQRVPLLNRPLGIASSRDKLRAIQLLSERGVGVPRTVLARDPEAIRAAIDSVGGTPVIVKLQQGTQGIGVMLIDSPGSVESVFDTLWGLGQSIILQEFIEEARGCDLRVIVVGGRVVAAMRRVARAGEFRSNLHRGGAGSPLDLSEEYAATAIAAAAATELEVAGVDILESHSGPRVIEVNSSPGLRGIEHCCGVDVAVAMVQRAEDLVAGR